MIEYQYFDLSWHGRHLVIDILLRQGEEGLCILHCLRKTSVAYAALAPASLGKAIIILYLVAQVNFNVLR